MGSIALSVSVENNSCTPRRPTSDGLLERPDINESLDGRGGVRGRVGGLFRPSPGVEQEFLLIPQGKHGSNFHLKKSLSSD